MVCRKIGKDLAGTFAKLDKLTQCKFLMRTSADVWSY